METEYRRKQRCRQEILKWVEADGSQAAYDLLIEGLFNAASLQTLETLAVEYGGEDWEKNPDA